MSIHLHRGDLPTEINFPGVVAIDTETMGLNPHRDRLCLVQLSAGDGVCHLVQFAPAATELPQLLVWTKSPALVPVTAMLVIESAALPELERGTA